jgi:hypothetical protein
MGGLHYIDPLIAVFEESNAHLLWRRRPPFIRVLIVSYLEFNVTCHGGPQSIRNPLVAMAIGGLDFMKFRVAFYEELT